MVIEEAQAGTRRPASSPIEARQPAIGQQVARDADASVRSPSPSASASVPVGCCPSPTARHRSPATSLVNVFLVENARARPRTDGRTYHALSLWLVATRPATGPPGLLDRRSRMNHPGSSLRRAATQTRCQAVQVQHSDNHRSPYDSNNYSSGLYPKFQDPLAVEPDLH
jgi:hypothetical protein